MKHKPEDTKTDKSTELPELSAAELELVAGGRGGVNFPRQRGGTAN
jgi:hypothetical protein